MEIHLAEPGFRKNDFPGQLIFPDQIIGGGDGIDHNIRPFGGKEEKDINFLAHVMGIDAVDVHVVLVPSVAKVGDRYQV